MTAFALPLSLTDAAILVGALAVVVCMLLSFRARARSATRRARSRVGAPRRKAMASSSGVELGTPPSPLFNVEMRELARSTHDEL